MDKDLDKRDKYKFMDEQIVNSFFTNILPGQKEKEIRTNLKAIMRKDLPFVTVYNFEYLKCNCTTITYPNAPKAF